MFTSDIFFRFTCGLQLDVDLIIILILLYFMGI